MCDGTADCADGTDEVGCEERAEDTTEAEDVFGFEETTTETTTETAASTAVTEEEEEVEVTTVAPTQEEELVQEEEEEDIFGFDEASTPDYEVTTPASRCNAACPRVNY